MRRATYMAAVTAALLCVAAPALGATADRQRVRAGYTSTTPGAPTGDFFRLTVRNPDDPAGKPPRVTRIVEIAEGSVTDPSALPPCAASDPQLMAEGGSACPPASLDGTGVAEFVSGLPTDPLVLDLQGFYNGHGLSTVATPRGSPAHLVSHTEFSGPNGEVATTDFPDMPGGPPDGHTVLRHTELHVPPHGDFFKTPSTCPATGRWRIRVIVTYADGVTQESDPTSRCAP